jgi:hypothetical protein
MELRQGLVENIILMKFYLNIETLFERTFNNINGSIMSAIARYRS